MAENDLLVDTGASTHILHDKDCSESNPDFNPASHFLELAAGRRLNNTTKGHG